MKTSAALAWRVFLVGVLTLAASPALADGDSLHDVIDRHLKPVAGIEPASCSDAEFLRRASLDLIGMPPTADEARAFLADPAGDKRERLVDRLLDSPHFARHLAATLDLMLMERRANTHVSADEWQAWLLRSVRENKPLNLLMREILLADGEDPATRPAARFALDRGSEPNLLARDIGRILFGRDLQCAQCHDHPLVDGYLQSDYQGLLAFVAPGYALPRKEGDKQFTVHAERAGTDLAFESVFAKGTPHRTGPRLPDDVTLDEPFHLPGDEYQVAPADNVKSIPKFSRRAKLAELATNGSNRAFNENLANRLWAHMLGRGLVHAVDLHHADNPATDPELLRMLGERLAAMNFDLRGFLREIALSQVYQRAFDLPPAVATESGVAAGEVARLEEQRAAEEQAAKASAEVFEQALAAWHQAEAAMLPAVGELDAARNQYAEARKKSDEAAKAVSDATAALQAKQGLATQLEQAAAAAKQASTLLAADQELAAATGQLAARAQQASNEVAALTTMVQEKTTAAQPLADALASVKTTVDAALATSSPAIAATRQAEQTMLAARRQADADASRSM
ncbi:MAG: DUF1549 domain-containing protein, partial [Pirellulaceae bacterium]|nr:DUF1549 domain-containing protein [Pirellulaceae bacterium]